MKNPWIFFDLDGTFVRWNYFYLWVKACVAAGLLPRIVLAEANRRLRTYKNRQGTFRAFTDSLLDAVLDGERLNGIRVDDMERVCEDLAIRSGRQTHVFCEELTASQGRKGIRRRSNRISDCRRESSRTTGDQLCFWHGARG